MRNRMKAVGSALVGLALILSACTVDGAGGTTTSPRRASNNGGQGQVVTGPRALATFDSCQPFLDYVISHAVDLVGPYGLENYFYGFPGVMRMDAVEEMAASDGGASVPQFSETNVQVLGVDEPDIVKTDGERIVILSEGTLIVADVTGERPVVEGRLHLGNLNVQSLFLNGDKALLFGSAWNSFHPLVEGDAEFAPSYQTPTIQLVEVDVTSGDPSVTRTMTIDGQFISGRMVDDTVRLVMRSGPVGFEWSYPTGSGLRAERKAIEENQEIIRNSDPDNWIPYYLVSDFRVNSVEASSVVGVDSSGAERVVPVDEIVVATGQRPNLEMTRELRLELDPALEAPVRLAPLIDPNVHSCLTVPAHGVGHLAHPESGFYTVGIKSYGRAPTFLMATGYKQVESVVSEIVG